MYGRANIVDATSGRMVPFAAKAAIQLPFISPLRTPDKPPLSLKRMVLEGYRGNSAVFPCVQVWTTTFPEPSLKVAQETENGSEYIPTHPLRMLIQNPNDYMGEDEFWAYVIAYMAIGGNCYVWKQRTNDGRPAALWPLHDGLMSPVSGETDWISHYVYDVGDGRQGIPVPRRDVVHLRWAVDPLSPTRGQAPLVAAARAVDADNETLRYQYALLTNDAVARTIVTLNEPVHETKLRELRSRFEEQYGGQNRGGVAFIEGAQATVTRLGANLQELAIEALYNIPESRIAAAFEVPPLMAGLNIGLQRPTGLGSTGDVMAQDFTVRRVVPRWRRVASQFTASLLPDYGDSAGLSCEFDTSSVHSMREDEGELRGSLSSAYLAGWITKNEARSRAGLPHVPSGDVFADFTSATEAAPSLDTSPPTDTGVPGAKAAHKPPTPQQVAARSKRDQAKLEAAMVRDVEKALADVKRKAVSG